MYEGPVDERKKVWGGKVKVVGHYLKRVRKRGVDTEKTIFTHKAFNIQIYMRKRGYGGKERERE